MPSTCADIARKQAQAPARADPDPRTCGPFDAKTKSLGSRIRRLRERRPHRRDLPGRLAGRTAGDRHRGRRPRAAAGPVRHALARGRLECGPADRGRRHLLARHGQRQRLSREPDARYRKWARSIGPHIEPAGYIEGESPFASRGGFVVSSVEEAQTAIDWYAAARLPPGQALQLDQARVGRSRSRPTRTRADCASAATCRRSRAPSAWCARATTSCSTSTSSC